MLTVKELIAELQKFSDDMPVITEGCDCYGETSRVELFTSSFMVNPTANNKLGNRFVIIKRVPFNAL